MGLGETISLTDVHIRAVGEDDDVQAITHLLHRAYKPLADVGMRFVATYQDEHMTRERFASGHGFVAIENNVIIATITIYPAQHNNKCLWYNFPGVWHFGQFGVEPVHQSIGVGSLLLSFAEHYAHMQGADELALDTAETAAELIEFYAARGYCNAGHVQWDITNYRSVVLSKKL
ncbi:MAG: GNAT family N-acetyltransferase [bacterium]|nr:GNAT family N-acetyltransferase [bacterium]